MDVAVRVDTRAVQRALRQVDRTLPRRVRVVGNDAAELGIRTARLMATTVGRQQARAAETLRGGSEQRRAVIRMGSRRVPWTAGAEYGSIRYRQFPAWRGSGRDAGYFVWPAIRRELPAMVHTYNEGVRRLFEEAGLATTRSSTP